MRLRNIKGSREMIAASAFVIHEEETRAGKWGEIFGNSHPIRIEIGMGKGKFIMTLAKENPHINYIWNREIFQRSASCAGEDGKGRASAAQSVFCTDGCRAYCKSLCRRRD